MDYYDLKLSTPIRVEQFIELYEKGLCIQRGGISVFEDSIGKPGDTIYSLIDVQVSYELLTIKFNFSGDEEILIQSPQNVYVNKKIIGIESFEKLTWSGLNFHLEYDFVNKNLVTKSLRGVHNFKINKKGIGFLFYSW